jgi:hypothetical protein
MINRRWDELVGILRFSIVFDISSMNRDLHKFVAFIFLIFGLSSASMAEDLSRDSLEGNYALVPRKIVRNVPEQWQETAEVESCLSIKKGPHGRMRVKIFTMASEADVCEVSGVGRIKGNSLLVESIHENESEFCRLRIDVLEDKILLKDGEPSCKKW